MDEIVKQAMAKWSEVEAGASDSLALSLRSARLREEALDRRSLLRLMMYG